MVPFEVMVEARAPAGLQGEANLRTPVREPGFRPATSHLRLERRRGLCRFLELVALKFCEQRFDRRFHVIAGIAAGWANDTRGVAILHD